MNIQVRRLANMALYDDTLRNLMALLDEDTSLNRSLIFRHLCDLIVQNRPIAQGSQRGSVLALIARLLPNVEPLARIEIAEQLCALSKPPVDIGTILACDDMTVARWILDRARFCDSDWLFIIKKLDEDRLTRLAKREGLSPTVREAILDALDPRSGQVAHQVIAASESQIQDMLSRLQRFGTSAKGLRAQNHGQNQGQDQDQDLTAEKTANISGTRITGRAANLFCNENERPDAPASKPQTRKPPVEENKEEENTESFAPIEQPHPSVDPRLFGVDALWECDRYGILTFTSSAREYLLGMNAELVTGQSIETLLNLPADISQRLHAQRPFDGAAPLRATQDQYWAIAAVPVFDAHSGVFSGFRGTLRTLAQAPVNRSDFKKRTTGSELCERNPLNLAHEIRTPLNAIRGFAELIDEQVWGPVGAPYRHRATRIMAEAARVENLANDLLDAGRLEIGRLDFSASATDVQLLVDNSLSMLRPEDRDKVNVVFSAPSATIWGDYRLLSRAVAKLVRTAACWTAPGRTIDMNVITGPDRLVRFTVDLPMLTKDKTDADFAGLMWCTNKSHHPLIDTALGYGLGPDFAAQLVDLFGGSLRLIRPENGPSQMVLTLQSSEVP